MTKKTSHCFFIGLLLLCGQSRADVTLTISSDDFGVGSIFNTVASFNFSITLAGTIAPGQTYNNPLLVNVNYAVQGVLSQPTPSGFPGFLLQREIDGNDFYALSPDAALRFAISPNANLSDGLQLSELSGTTDALYFNARELNQNPGRYHPPILRLNNDGTGSLANADNQSTFPNPDPPIGSGQLVDVTVGEEYSVVIATDLTVNLSDPIAQTSQVPLFASPLLAIFSFIAWRALSPRRQHSA